MTALSITYPSFTSGTTIVSAQVNQNNTDIVNYINARNGATANWDAVSTVGAFTSTLTSSQIILGTTRTVTISAGTPASSSRVWTIPDISSAGTFAALEGTQSFTGAKTFSGNDLNVNGQTSPNIYITSNSAGSPVQLRFLASTTSAGYVQTQSNHPLIFTTNNGQTALAVDTNQNVGIRTQTPGFAQADIFAGTSPMAFTCYQTGTTLGPTIELANASSTDGLNLGALSFVNTNNAGLGSGTSFTKTVAYISALEVGTGNNSGGSLAFFTKPSGGSLAKILTIDSAADIYTTGFTDYSSTSTIVGWTSFTTKLIFYKKIGKMVWVWFNLSGTSNSTSATFTLPFTNANSLGVLAISQAKDNGGTAVAGGTNVDPNTALAFATPTVGSGSTAWTASGTKQINGQFFYQTT